MPQPSIPADDSAEVIPPAPDAADNGTDKTIDNPDASKSDDTTVVTDDDKKSEDTKTTTSEDDTPASQLDDDLDDWISKRGLPVATTDEEKQAYQDQRDSQREFTREQQAKKDAVELSKTQSDAKTNDDDDDDDKDPIEKRQDAIEKELKEERTTRMQSEFYISNKITAPEHQAILDVYKEKVNKPTTPEGKRAAFELWSSPDALPDLLDLAKARIVKATDNSAVIDEATQKERERIAKESQAKSPSRSASTTTTPEKSEDEARTERFRARYNKQKVKTKCKIMHKKLLI